MHCGLGGAKLRHFMARKDGGTSIPFFMGVEAFTLKSTVVVLLGRRPISNPPGYHCVRLKRVRSWKTLGFISLETVLLTTWLGWTHLTWLGWMNLMSCSKAVSWDTLLTGAGNQQFHPTIIFSGRIFGSKSWLDSPRLFFRFNRIVENS